MGLSLPEEPYELLRIIGEFGLLFLAGMLALILIFCVFSAMEFKQTKKRKRKRGSSVENEVSKREASDDCTGTWKK